MANIYMMHSTTAPLDPRVRERMLPLLDEDPRKPAGLLSDGRMPARILEESRGHVAALVGARPEEIVFTSGGTEACNLALKGIALARIERVSKAGKGGPAARILVAGTEHTAVLYPARTLARLGFEVRELPVDRWGVVALDALTDMLGASACLVSVALATAETGTLQPVEEIARIVHERGALLHTDACLAAGSMSVDVKTLGVDLASLSAHKMAGPRGVGALYVRDGLRLTPQIEGGVNESGRRGGTEYLAGIAGFGEAARLAEAEMSEREPRLAGLGTMMQEAFAGLEGVTLNGHPERRLRSLVNVSVSGVEGEALLLKLAARGIAASSGSSCFQETGKPSHVLLAMGMDPELARSSVLFSAGLDTSAEEIRRVVDLFPRTIAALRAIAVRPRP